MRGNRSAAVTATRGRGGGGWREGGGKKKGGGRMGESEGFNANARDVCKTDVGLCSGNGPWVALLA